MRKLLSDVVGMPLYVESSPERPLSVVRDILVDPETGAIVAFVCIRKKVVIPRDVIMFNNALFIRSHDDLLDFEDVIRVRDVMRTVPTIVGLPVYGEDNKTFVGRVVDFEFDVVACVLTAIYTARLLFFVRYNERIIAHHNIIKIQSDRILVRNAALVKATAKAKTLAEAEAFELKTPSPA